MSAKGNTATVLIVDDEPDIRDIIATQFSIVDCDVLQAGNISQAMELLETFFVDAVLSDVRMPGGSGIDLLESYRKRNPNGPPFFLLSAYTDISSVEAAKRGAAALLQKPFDLKELVDTVMHEVKPTFGPRR